MRLPVPLVRIVRSGLEESVHLGDVVVCDASGRVMTSAGDPERSVYARSSMKPLQAAVSLSRLDDDVPTELVAIMCASHNGEPEHVAAVRRLLRGGNVALGALRCPEDVPSRRRDVAAAPGPRRIFHNCSGKHAGMLRACAARRWDLETYRSRGHPLQRAVAAAVVRATSVTRPHIGVDGCGVPVFGVPLRAMATLFARLGDPSSLGRLEPHVRKAVSAMRAHPFLVAGTGRADTAIMQHTPNVIAKVGAEALFCAADIGRGLGVAVKIADGGDRASGPALVAALRAVDAIDDRQRERIDLVARRPILGGGEPVGEMLVDVPLVGG
jgi:L-asparaginase II